MLKKIVVLTLSMMMIVSSIAPVFAGDEDTLADGSAMPEQSQDIVSKDPAEETSEEAASAAEEPKEEAARGEKAADTESEQASEDSG